MVEGRLLQDRVEEQWPQTQCLRREVGEAGDWKTAALGVEVQPQEEVGGRPGPLQQVQKG